MKIQNTTPRHAAGFTLIEMMVAVSVAGILSSVAYPSFNGQIHKARRADALVAMVQVQAAQERWRSVHRDYATLDDLGLPARSTAGHYALSVTQADDERYEVLASAVGSQAGDRACRHLKLTLDGASIAYASGDAPSTDNPAELNRRCWNL